MTSNTLPTVGKAHFSILTSTPGENVLGAPLLVTSPPLTTYQENKSIGEVGEASQALVNQTGLHTWPVNQTGLPPAQTLPPLGGLEGSWGREI
jgi:hypothetical protein